jgi:hypothetical protein
VLGRTVLVAPVSGSVSVRVSGTATFERLQAPLELPVRTEIDTRSGTMSVTEATAAAGGVEVANVSGGRAIVTQRRVTAAPTDFTLSQRLDCKGRVAAAGGKRPKVRRRHVMVSEHGGNWDTRAQYVATAAEGTNWTTTDTCGASTVNVRAGHVAVTNLVTHVTVTLAAGQHVTAKSAKSASKRSAKGSLSDGLGGRLIYSVQTNLAANAFRLILPSGNSITGTSAPAGFSCHDTGNVEECTKGGVKPNTQLVGIFDHTAAIAANCGCVRVEFSADGGVTWSAPTKLAGPPNASPPSTLSGPPISGSFGAGTASGTVDYALNPTTSINAYELIAPTGDAITSNFAPSGWSCANLTSNIVECMGPALSSPFTGILKIAVPTLSSLDAAASTNSGNTWGPAAALGAG